MLKPAVGKETVVEQRRRPLTGPFGAGIHDVCGHSEVRHRAELSAEVRHAYGVNYWVRCRRMPDGGSWLGFGSEPYRGGAMRYKV
jgi:hypothetical protein